MRPRASRRDSDISSCSSWGKIGSVEPAMSLESGESMAFVEYLMLFRFNVQKPKLSKGKRAGVSGFMVGLVIVLLAWSLERDKNFRAELDSKPMPSPEPSPKLKVLVIENDKTNARLARLILEKSGYVTDVATNGREGVEGARQQVFDVILMDIHMPVMSGFEAAR